MSDQTWPATPAYRRALVLGAGGVRGFAHVGALKVIERHKVRFDLVVGVSMGSFVGAGYAAGLLPAEMEQVARTVSFRTLFKPRLGRGALVDPTAAHDVVRRLLGDRRFEDLDRELAVLAASATTGQAVVIRTGSVADAVIASTAIPLIFPPVPSGGDFLMDGTMIDGLPVQLARQLGAEIVVAIDADNHARRFLRAPGIRQTMLLLARSMDRRNGATNGGTLPWRVLTHMLERREAELPDLLIRPSFGRITSFHYPLWSRCVDLGEAAAREALTDLLALDRPAGAVGSHVDLPERRQTTRAPEPQVSLGLSPAG